jgi:hypothetical protein
MKQKNKKLKLIFHELLTFSFLVSQNSNKKLKEWQAAPLPFNDFTRQPFPSINLVI